jgi:hypothetical protein
MQASGAHARRPLPMTIHPMPTATQVCGLGDGDGTDGGGRYDDDATPVSYLHGMGTFNNKHLPDGSWGRHVPPTLVANRSFHSDGTRLREMTRGFMRGNVLQQLHDNGFCRILMISLFS